VAELGYSIGDIVTAFSGYDDCNNANGGWSVTVDATNINIKVGAGGCGLIRKDTGGSFRTTNGNWSMIWAAYA
jgi:hypothetical protein